MVGALFPSSLPEIPFSYYLLVKIKLEMQVEVHEPEKHFLFGFLLNKFYVRRE